MRSYAQEFSTRSNDSAPIIARPAAFICTRRPSRATILMHSGVVSTIVRSNESRSGTALAGSAIRAGSECGFIALAVSPIVIEEKGRKQSWPQHTPWRRRGQYVTSALLRRNRKNPLCTARRLRCRQERRRRAAVRAHEMVGHARPPGIPLGARDAAIVIGI